jgi:hypothetical protein
VPPAATSVCSASLHDRFVAALRKNRPDVWVEHEARVAATASRRAAESRLAQLFREPDSSSIGAVSVTCSRQQESLGVQQHEKRQQREQDSMAEQTQGCSRGFTFGFQLSVDADKKHQVGDHQQQQQLNQDQQEQQQKQEQEQEQEHEQQQLLLPGDGTTDGPQLGVATVISCAKRTTKFSYVRADSRDVSGGTNVKRARRHPQPPRAGR